MKFSARAPGKLVVLGEYAVLQGGNALVAAIDRCCFVTIEASAEDRCEVITTEPGTSGIKFPVNSTSGHKLIDTVTEGVGHPSDQAFRATIDSRPLYATDGNKFGFGSSAAVLAGFAAAYASFTSGRTVQPKLGELIDLHRKFQDGHGSGLDVAAAVCGGMLKFRLESAGDPSISSVQMPNSVGFAGIFTGASAKTADFVSRFQAWQDAEPDVSGRFIDQMRRCSDAGCSAAEGNDAAGFLAAIDVYGELLEALGQHIDRDVMTSAHREIKQLADRYGVTYKLSGAGGGDIGVAFAVDNSALRELKVAIVDAGFQWLDIELDKNGLVVEELVA